MTLAESRAAEIFRAAKKAVSKIADPAQRAKATKSLEATQKKVTTAQRQSQTKARQPNSIKDRDIDIER